MNPFLHDAVARPLAPPAESVHPAGKHPAAGAPRRPCTWGTLARIAGVAALAWAGSAAAVDLNTASPEQLQSVRGIGPKTARIILEERDRGGRYESFSDLSDRVRGIGPRRARALQAAGLTIDGGAPDPSPGSPAKP